MKVQNQMATQVYSIKQRRVNPFLSELFQKIEEEILPNSFYITITTLIPKTKIPYIQKRKLQASITDEHRCKSPQQILAIQIPQYIKRIIYHDQEEFIPEMQGFFFFYICKPVSVIHQIILTGEKLKAFPLRSGRRQACLLSPLLFNTVLGALANQKEKK